MGFHDVAFLPSRASFATTFLEDCGRDDGLGTTMSKNWLCVSNGILSV